MHQSRPANATRTKYSNLKHKEMFETASAHQLEVVCEHVLWDCSIEWMTRNGLPLDGDVEMWVEWLKQRPDANSVEIQGVIFSCQEYLKPPPEISHDSEMDITQPSEG